MVDGTLAVTELHAESAILVKQSHQDKCASYTY